MFAKTARQDLQFKIKTVEQALNNSVEVFRITFNPVMKSTDMLNVMNASVCAMEDRIHGYLHRRKALKFIVY